MKEQLIADYASGPVQLSELVRGMSAEELHATPIKGTWSTHQVICHLADAELVYSDRMKRVIAEDEPSFFGMDPNQFAERLAYDSRATQTELETIVTIRSHVLSILKTLEPQDFQRRGTHRVDGPLTLEELLRRITNHIPHHMEFIRDKQNALRTR